jgi:hypothetical protein
VSRHDRKKGVPVSDAKLPKNLVHMQLYGAINDS